MNLNSRDGFLSGICNASVCLQDALVQSVRQLLGDTNASGTASDDDIGLFQDLDLIVLG